MYRSISALLAVIVAGSLSAQELIANGSFEQVGKEPTAFDQLDLCAGWSNVTIGLSEVFSPSAPARTIGIPANEYGSMEPAEGARYAGFFGWKDDMRRDFTAGADDPFKPGWSAYSEYIRTELTAPLEADGIYEVSFRVALAQNSDRAIAGIGAYCGPEPIRYQHRRFLQERPQVSADGILGARGEWVEVRGRFVADGGERYLVIGVFPLAGFDAQRIIEGADNQYAYYFIDAVSLKRVLQP